MMSPKDKQIKQKVPFVECDADLEDFLMYWQEDREPTQRDYNKWAKEELWAALCNGCFYMKDIKIRDKK